jgi:DNA-binding transcriptional ArsR family regulator
MFAVIEKMRSFLVALPATHLSYNGVKSKKRRCTMRRADRERLEGIWKAVEREPGVRPAGVARRLGVSRSSVTRALPAMEGAGLLLSEDPQGKLWPWKRRT